MRHYHDQEGISRRVLAFALAGAALATGVPLAARADAASGDYAAPNAQNVPAVRRQRFPTKLVQSQGAQTQGVPSQFVQSQPQTQGVPSQFVQPQARTQGIPSQFVQSQAQTQGVPSQFVPARSVQSQGVQSEGVQYPAAVAQNTLSPSSQYPTSQYQGAMQSLRNGAYRQARTWTQHPGLKPAVTGRPWEFSIGVTGRGFAAYAIAADKPLLGATFGLQMRVSYRFTSDWRFGLMGAWDAAEATQELGSGQGRLVTPSGGLSGIPATVALEFSYELHRAGPQSTNEAYSLADTTLDFGVGFSNFGIANAPYQLVPSGKTVADSGLNFFCGVSFDIFTVRR